VSSLSLVLEPKGTSFSVPRDLEGSDGATAGGSDGSGVRMRRSNGWWRARPVGCGWTVDKGPDTD
jgi:hypothetical protein